MNRFPTAAVSFVFVSFLLLLSTGSVAIADGTVDKWKIDDSRSTLTFTSDAPAEKIVGNSEGVDGEINWNRENPSESTGKIYFPVESMRTGNSLRDRHLQSPGWLNAEENPNVTFELRGLEDVELDGDDARVDIKATAVGTVTLNGVTNEESADVEIAILNENKVARVKPSFEFALADYDVEGSRGGTIGREVGSTIEIEALLYFDW